jgi:hypothetical protein
MIVIFLEDLLAAPDFEKALDTLAPDFRKRFLGLPWWPMDAVFKTVARVQKWTGKRSLSV